MQLINLAIFPIVMSLVFLSACEVSNHEKHSEIQQSASKGKSKMQPQSPMLKEIFASEKYIPLVSPKMLVIFFLNIYQLALPKRK
jgi:hypothetical protein